MLQSMINSMPFYLATAVTGLFMFLFNKYVIRAKDLKYFNHKILSICLLPYLSVAFILFNVIITIGHWNIHVARKKYQKRFVKYTKVR